jgi:hypothetical protein
MSPRLPLTLLPRRIARLTGAPAPSYRSIYMAALGARFPAEQGQNGRWTVAIDDLPAIVQALGLTMPHQHAA